MRLRTTLILCIAFAITIAGCATEPEPTDDEPTAEDRAVELLDSDLIPVADSPIRGDENAWVTIVVFADFQCPFCARLAATLDEVKELYDQGTVRLVFKHFPLEHHDAAMPAARGAEAAHQQGKFWQMHDALFDQLAGLQGDDPQQVIFDTAQRLGLDEEQFQRDFESDETTARIEADRQLADELQLDSVPAVFVNGGYISGARSADVYHSAVQNVYEILRHGVTTGEIERDAIYKSSVETLLDHTSPEKAGDEPRATPVVELPVDQGISEGELDDALVNIGVFLDLGEDSSHKILRLLDEVAHGDDEVRFSYFHLFDDSDEATSLAHRLLEGAESNEQRKALLQWLADDEHPWRDDPSLLEQFGDDHDIDPADTDQLHQSLQQDLDTARDYEVYGTPTFFINGIRFVGVPDEEDVEEVLDEQLALALRIGEIKGVTGMALYEQMVKGNQQRQ